MAAIEYGLVSVLIALVVITGVAAMGPHPKPPASPPTPHCPNGSLYIPHLAACLAGASEPTFK